MSVFLFDKLKWNLKERNRIGCVATHTRHLFCFEKIRKEKGGFEKSNLMSLIGVQSTHLQLFKQFLSPQIPNHGPRLFCEGGKFVTSLTLKTYFVLVSINFRTQREKVSLDLIFLLPMILSVVQMDGRHVEIAQGALVNGMD